MAVIESTHNTNDLDKLVLIICPICKVKKQVSIPKSIISEAKQLSSISISKNIVCDHHFQAFIDKNFIVRGYQKVDYQLESHLNKKERKSFNNSLQNDNELFDNLILESNYVEYRPKKIINQNPDKHVRNKTISNSKVKKKKKKMKLEDIYEEFWEFIDDDNEEFSNFIRKDTRRRNNK